MCDEPDESAPSGTPEEQREQVLARLRALASERRTVDERRRSITEQMHSLLRQAHDLGSTWQEIADSAGYKTAVSARNQALSPGTGGDAAAGSSPPDSYTVREAARRLGVTQKTVYDWIKSGRIVVADERVRGRRVFLPDSTSSPD